MIGLMFSGITIPSIMTRYHYRPMCNSALLEKMDCEFSAGCRPTHGVDTTAVPQPASLRAGLLLHLIAA